MVMLLTPFCGATTSSIHALSSRNRVRTLVLLMPNDLNLTIYRYVDQPLTIRKLLSSTWTRDTPYWEFIDYVLDPDNTGRLALQHCCHYYTVSQKTRHLLVIVISSNLNWFSKFIHCWKVC